MPSLTEDILLDIVHQIGQMYQGQECTDALTKFMLSGQESFTTTLKYFLRLSWIEFHKDYFDVGRSDEYFTIPYDFVLLRPILQMLTINVERIYVSSLENEKSHAILERLITKKTKFMHVLDAISEKQMALLQKCKLETLIIDGCDCIRNWSKFSEDEIIKRIYDMLMIPSSCHEMNTQFHYFLAALSNGRIFDKVEELAITQCQCCVPGNDYLVKEDDMKILGENLVKCFPNLKKIKATFRHFTDARTWEERLSLKNLIHPKFFEGIPTRIQGMISFEVYYFIDDYLDYSDTFVNEGDLEYDEKKGSLSKKLNVHEDLIVRVNYSWY